MGGRHQIGTVGEIIPEWWATSSGISILLNNEQRAEMTASCRDCDHIPKVPDAGWVFAGDGRPVQIMHNGVRVVAGGYYGDWMTSIIARLHGHHEPQEEGVSYAILKNVTSDATMLELGGF
jgi:hypothetical protein